MLEILYRDQWLIAVNKPSGLLVHRSFLDPHATEFAMQMLRDQIGQHVFPLHRLDRPTSGVLLFALSAEWANAMMAIFAERAIEKRYLALCRGFAPTEQRLDYPLKEELDKIADKFADQDKPAQEAVTRFRCLAQAEVAVPVGKWPCARLSLVECWPETGRKHQIRRHLKHLSHPIFCDVNHGDGRQNRFFREHFAVDRLMLHCQAMRFSHPYTQQPLLIQAPLGETWLGVCARLGWSANELDYRLS